MKLWDRLKSVFYVPFRTCHLAWKWDGLDGHDPVCSRCGREWPGKHYEKLRYCPHCGARVIKEGV